MKEVVARLVKDFPEIRFARGKTFCWSPQTRTVTYSSVHSSEVSAWSLFHEVGHALLDHRGYDSDFELLLLEVRAWEKAVELAKTYGVEIDSDHVQDCLDTYRDWIHQRSTCPQCGNQSLQEDSRTYRCFNCRSVWKVTASRFCRPYRRTHGIATTLKSPARLPGQAIFR